MTVACVGRQFRALHDVGVRSAHAATCGRERIPTAGESAIRPRFVPDSFHSLNTGLSRDSSTSFAVALWYKRARSPHRPPNCPLSAPQVPNLEFGPQDGPGMITRDALRAPDDRHVDTCCMDGGAARTVAPKLIVEGAGRSVFAQHLETAEDVTMPVLCRARCRSVRCGPLNPRCRPRRLCRQHRHPRHAGQDR
jgi:hypothetical protein